MVDPYFSNLQTSGWGRGFGIARRDETAAVGSQPNTAKLLADNPTLMRLRELEVLENVASTGKLNIVLGEKGLAERVVNLL